MPNAENDFIFFYYATAFDISRRRQMAGVLCTRIVVAAREEECVASTQNLFVLNWGEWRKQIENAIFLAIIFRI